MLEVHTALVFGIPAIPYIDAGTFSDSLASFLALKITPRRHLCCSLEALETTLCLISPRSLGGEARWFCDRTNMSVPKQTQLQVEGVDNLLSTLKQHEGKKIYVMFIGSIGDDGENWCPDCRRGEFWMDFLA